MSNNLIKKSHPESVIRLMDKDSESSRTIFNHDYVRDCLGKHPIVVLQVLAVNDKVLIVEFVRQQDLDKFNLFRS